MLLAWASRLQQHLLLFQQDCDLALKGETTMPKLYTNKEKDGERKREREREKAHVK
jgi:hypothetical protein